MRRDFIDSSICALALGRGGVRQAVSLLWTFRGCYGLINVVGLVTSMNRTPGKPRSMGNALT